MTARHSWSQMPTTRLFNGSAASFFCGSSRLVQRQGPATSTTARAARQVPENRLLCRSSDSTCAPTQGARLPIVLIRSGAINFLDDARSRAIDGPIHSTKSRQALASKQGSSQTRQRKFTDMNVILNIFIFFFVHCTIETRFPSSDEALGHPVHLARGPGLAPLFILPRS